MEMHLLFAREESRASILSASLPPNSQILPAPHAQKLHTLTHAVSFVLPVFNLMITAAGEALVTADVNAAESLPLLCMSSKRWSGLPISPVSMAEDE